MTTQKLPPPPLRKANGGSPSATPVSTPPREWEVTQGRKKTAQSVLVYGCAGIGKSSLVGHTPNPVIIDLEGGTNEIDVRRISGIHSWQDLRAVVQSNALDPFDTIGIDSATKAEELATIFTLANVPHEKGHLVDRLEEYGFSKGLSHVYETFLLLLQDLDALLRKGKNVVLIAHDCISEVPNPVGDNFIRYEPHLQSPKSGKSSIRNRVVQWANHVLFLSYDVVSKDGKGKGGGTRTIWTTDRPDHIAKVRGKIEDNVPDSMVYDVGDGSIWSLILPATAAATAPAGGAS